MPGVEAQPAGTKVQTTQRGAAGGRERLCGAVVSGRCPCPASALSLPLQTTLSLRVGPRWLGAR